VNFKNITYDLKSGIVVFLVALPLCLGIAMASGVPLVSGIISGIIGGLIVSLFSNSVYSVSGPAAGLTSIVLMSVASLGSFSTFLAAVLFAGILQLILGVVKAGSISNYIPNSVIKGMLAGIGIILIIKQVPHLVGYDKDPEGDFDFFQIDGHNTFSDLAYMFNYVTFGSIIIGLISLILMFLSEAKWYKKSWLSILPMPLLVVLIGILLSLSFDKTAQLNIDKEHFVEMPVISNLNELLAVLVRPNFDLIYQSKFWIVVITLAVVASLETLLSIEAVDKLDTQKRHTNTNRELIAQGIGNILCGLLGALPVTSVIVRSSANINAGARSKFSSIFHAILLLLSFIFIPTLLMLIPKAALAGILIFTGYKLAKISLFKDQYKRGIDQFIPFSVTIAVMLATDLLKGVLVGLAVAIVFIIRNNIRSTFEFRQEFLNDQLHYIVRLPQQVTFFNKGFLLDYLTKLDDKSTIIIDGSINKLIDNDVKDVLNDFLITAKDKNIKVELVKVNLN
jgi:MFS superfamily sulfate permease-like transporter